jgi:hypothetical protein
MTWRSSGTANMPIAIGENGRVQACCPLDEQGLGLLGRLRRSGTCPGKKVASRMILLGEA